MDLKIKNFYNLQNLTFLNYKSFLFLNPWILFFLSFNLFSMGGIPPLSGFFSKFLLFNVLFDNNNFTLLIIALFFSLLIIFYYIRIIKILIFTKYDFSYINLYYPIKYVKLLLSNKTLNNKNFEKKPLNGGIPPILNKLNDKKNNIHGFKNKKLL